MYDWQVGFHGSRNGFCFMCCQEAVIHVPMDLGGAMGHVNVKNSCNGKIGTTSCLLCLS